MSGYFRGPSLFTHLVVLAVLLAVGIPLLARVLGSNGRALAAGFGFAVLYGIVALALAIPRGRPR